MPLFRSQNQPRLTGKSPLAFPLGMLVRGWLPAILTMGIAFHAYGQFVQQPAWIDSGPPWGGQLVPEKVPFQPNLERIDRGSACPPMACSPSECTPMACPPMDCPPGEYTEYPATVCPPMVAQPGYLITTPPPVFLPLIAEGSNDTLLSTAEDETVLPPGTRDGIFQKIFFTGTWLPQLDGGSLGWGDLETGVVLGFPFLRRDTPLLITPRFAIHLLDKPEAVDLPDQVYDTSFEFRHLRKFGNSSWGMDAAVTLGYYSDFERSSSDAFQVTGYGLVAYESSPGIKWVLGAASLNRAGATVLPIGGVLIERSPSLRWELVVPRPRVAWRLAGSVPDRDERWFYLAADFGGGGWSIVRPDSQQLDRLFYSDYRLLIGYERKIIGGLSRFFELGYVFNRELEFDSPTPQASLDDTLYLRAGLTY